MERSKRTGRFALVYRYTRYDANYLTLYRARRNGDYSVSKVPSTGGSDNDRKISVLVATMATTPSGHHPSFRRVFLFPTYRTLALHPCLPTRQRNNNGALQDCVHVYTHTDTHTAPSMEVFRASIMASTHLRSISAYGVRPQERSLPPWTSSNVASDSPSPPSTETIRRLSSIWRRKERVGPARTSRAAMGADKLLLGNLVNRERVYSLFRSLLRE